MKTLNHQFENKKFLVDFLQNIILQSTDQVLVRIHSAIHTTEEIKEVIAVVKQIIPQAHIIGCSAAQIICEGKVIPKSCLVSVSVFEAAEIVTGRINCMKEDGNWKDGQQIAGELVQKLPEKASGFMFVFFPLVYSKIEKFINTFNASELPVWMLGGAACVEDEDGKINSAPAYVIEGEQPAVLDMVYAYISGKELNIYGDYVCGAEPIGRRSVISSDGCLIQQVDGINGAQWYEAMLGKENLQKDPTLAQVFPVIKRDGKGITYYVEYIQEGKDSILKSFGELEDKSQISVGYFHPEKIYDLVKGVMKNIESQPAEAIFAYDCQSRMSLLHNCAAWENANFSTTNISGALLAGEISSTGGKNLYANYSFVLAALSEHKESHFILSERKMGSVQDLQEDNVQMVNYLLMNANKHLNEELADQQTKMKDAIFYNSTMVLENQLKYQYDKESICLDKTAILLLNNEKMLRLFSGLAKTYEFLRDSYASLGQKFRMPGLYIYSYEETSLLLAADSQITAETFVQLVDEIQLFLDKFSYEGIQLSYTAVISLQEEESLQRLESGLHYAKSNKLTKVCLDEMEDKLQKEQEDIHMLWVIREALLHRRIVPFFQEIHDNENGTKRMFESLLRLYDEEGKIYYPNSFLPVAKEYDLYESLSELMVETVMDMFEKKDIRVTINLNVQDIYNRKMLRMIFDKMQKTPYPENFVFELIESEEVRDYEYIQEFSDRIHECGGKVAIDDFGSGFSSLLHILNIRADYIKIDGEIIRKLTEDARCRDFLEFINAWCEKVGQELICEYVENEQIQEIMEDIGVHHSQGYYFSKPHPWSEEDEKAVALDGN